MNFNTSVFFIVGRRTDFSYVIATLPLVPFKGIISGCKQNISLFIALEKKAAVTFFEAACAKCNACRFYVSSFIYNKSYYTAYYPANKYYTVPYALLQAIKRSFQ